MNCKRLNNIFGWTAFLFAFTVFVMTIEKSASWWDCGEFIACSYKLQVGHPPGAPLFIMAARIFSLLSFGNPARVPVMINILSALTSALAVMFLFWTITALAKKALVKNESLDKIKTILIFGSGFTGALAFTFCDSFWFSAVEGELYASSALFTSLVFWAVIKWDGITNDKKADRWLILIAYLMGLSIGVHLLNLLVIPAITFVYYFKRFKTTAAGVILTTIIAFSALLFVQYGIIPGLVQIAAKFELVFVNGLGLPFGSGIIVYAFILIVSLMLMIWLSHKKRKTHLNTAAWALTFIILGYTSYTMILIRSNAGTPLNENAPADVFSLTDYLNREQYGDRPLFYGQYYNAELKDRKDGKTIYAKGKNKYEAVGTKPVYIYDSKQCTVFPRMYSSDKYHISAYKEWGGIKAGKDPEFINNLKFFFTYQLGHMYFRYFLWNFAGRQNDIQGEGETVNGNWISGIKFIDEARLGPQDNLPDNLSKNKARNKFYLLPLLLGILGILFHFKHARKDAVVVSILFVMTGIAIVLYLNQTPYQPRERDYSYAGSFMAFCIWIGLGVLSLYESVPEKVKKFGKAWIAIAVSVLSLVLVPGIMGKEGWDDHDRSGKTTAHDFALNYLNSCAPNAILFTNGDNDTFPLWYAQEVEGIRTDVRVLNYTLAAGSWYPPQLHKKVYQSGALPFILPSEKYKEGMNDYVPYYESGIKGPTELSKLIEFMGSDDPKAKVTLEDGEQINFLPVKEVFIPVDAAKVIKNGTVTAEMKDRIEPEIRWTIRKNYLFKNELMLLDIIAANQWTRPVYFVSPSSVRGVLDVDRYCYLEGYVYHFIPVKSDTLNYIRGMGGVNTGECYDILMNKFLNGALDNIKVPVYYDCQSNTKISRNNFARVAQALIIENKKDSARKILNRCIQLFPDKTLPFDLTMLPFAQLYYSLGEKDRADNIMKKIIQYYCNNLQYYNSVNSKFGAYFTNDKNTALRILRNIASIASSFGQKELASQTADKIRIYSSK